MLSSLVRAIQDGRELRKMTMIEDYNIEESNEGSGQSRDRDKKRNE